MSKKALIITFFFFAITTISSFSQILNIEKFRSNLDTSKAFFASARAGLELKQKNSQSLKIHSSASLAYLSDKHTYILTGNFQSTKIDRSEIFNQGYIHNRLELFRKNKTSFEPYIQSQYDLGKGLKRRHLFGLNIRHNIYSDSSIYIYIGTGGFHENENWFNTEINSIKNINFKSNNYLSIRYDLSKKTNLFLTSYYQAPFNDLNNARIIIDSNFQLKFDEHFSYDIHYELQYDQAPIISTAELNYLLKTGLRYTF